MSKTTTTTYQVQGMCCSSEIKLVEDTLGPLRGVEQVHVSLASGSVRVVHALDFGREKVEEALVPVGLSARERKRPGADGAPSRPAWYRDGELIAVMVASLFILAGLIFTKLLGLQTLGIGAYLVATAVGGFPVVRNALQSAKRLDLDIHVLMTVAVIGALILGEWLEAAMVVGLFALAEWLEGASMARARGAIGELMELSPDRARVVRDGQQQVVPIEQVDIGDHVIVRPGEKIAVDGIVESGESEVDQSPITGESKPSYKQSGDEVFAGTLNQRGSLDIRVDHAPDDTTLARVIEAIETAQQNRSESERFVERFARWYTPAVMGLAVLAATVPPLFFAASWQTWFYRSLVLLVIACPCALVLATPITTASSLARAARDGILIKGGRFLEELGRIRAVAFDKTGTLTRGEPKVTEVVAADGFDRETVIATAALAESRSEHYLARAIVEAAKQRNLEVSPERIVSFEARVGRGVSAIAARTQPNSIQTPGPKLLVGSRALFEEDGVDYTSLADQWATLEHKGQTVVAVARDGECLGLIAIEDTPRPGARETLARLRQQGIGHIYMLTGDNQATAHGIADELGLDHDSVLANLLPAQKVDAIEALAKRHQHIAMVGDGINDAPALAAAPVGIAMGAAGTDIALDTAHVALMADDLERLPQAIDLGTRTGQIIRQNIVLAIGIKVAVFALAAVGMATLWMAVLADMGTSLLVIFNGMRMLRGNG
jgi:Cd2+/Zn2+-exporting ATPase